MTLPQLLRLFLLLFFLTNSFLFIDFRERKREKERNINLLFHLFMHCLLLVCALNRERTSNLGVSGCCSNKVRYPSKAFPTLKCWCFPIFHPLCFFPPLCVLLGWPYPARTLAIIYLLLVYLGVVFPRECVLDDLLKYKKKILPLFLSKKNKNKLSLYYISRHTY